VYHEHRFFYSLASFHRLAAMAGLAVNGWDRTPAQGGSLRVRLGRSHLSESRMRRDNELLADMNRWLENPVTYAGMQGRAEYARRQLQYLVQEELDGHRQVAGFGASAKSSTLLNFCWFTPQEIQWVEDVTPGKIGRYTPGTGIPIRGPGEWPDTYLMLSWNYASTVIRRQRDFLESGGRMIIPGAVPVLL
jgi:novobiocin biosynthesis protein NovU/D-mycarose 3-C-methyltransferase